MHIFLETERLVLRRFTEADVGNLFDLDGDPEVMRFLTGGKSTPRDVIENETLPRFLAYYERSERFGFWAAIEKSAGAFLARFAFHCHPPSGAMGIEACQACQVCQLAACSEAPVIGAARFSGWPTRRPPALPPDAETGRGARPGPPTRRRLRAPGANLRLRRDTRRSLRGYRPRWLGSCR